MAWLYNIRAVQHEPTSQKNGCITQHYGDSLKKIFELYPVITNTYLIARFSMYVVVGCQVCNYSRGIPWSITRLYRCYITRVWHLPLFQPDCWFNGKRWFNLLYISLVCVCTCVWLSAAWLFIQQPKTLLLCICHMSCSFTLSPLGIWTLLWGQSVTIQSRDNARTGGP